MDARDPGAAAGPTPTADPPTAAVDPKGAGAAKPQSKPGRPAKAARAGKAVSTSGAKKADPLAEAKAKTPRGKKAAGAPSAGKKGKAARARSERASSGPEATAAPRPRRGLTTTMAMARSTLPTRVRPGAAGPAAPTCLYQTFFGLQREPFSIAPDPRAMYMSERHREAVAHLLYGVQGGQGGFVVLTGEIGAGKTTVSRCVLEQMPAQVRVALILNPRQNAEELLATICEEFGVKVPGVADGLATVALTAPHEPRPADASTGSAPALADPVSTGPAEARQDAGLAVAGAPSDPLLGMHAIEPTAGPAWADRVEPPLRRSTKRYVDALGRFLLDSHGRGRHCVLIIDEAQSLGADVLEQLRLLTNLELNDRKLLQIVLIGQPELRALIATPSMEHLAQRVIARYHLGALTEEETAKYIRHRMTAAGLAGVVPFDELALKRVHKLTRGIPRRINLLCDRALLGAWSRGNGVVDVTIVQKAHTEVRGEDDSAGASPSSPKGYAGILPEASRRSARTLVWAVAGILLGLLAVVWYVRSVPVSTPSASPAATAGGPAAGSGGERAPK